MLSSWAPLGDPAGCRPAADSLGALQKNKQTKNGTRIWVLDVDVYVDIYTIGYEDFVFVAQISPKPQKVSKN